jgi:cAMP-dependent protein kinase regulator
MEVKQYTAVEYVIKQGENGEVLYVVYSGELDLYKKFVSIQYLIFNINRIKKKRKIKLVKIYGLGDSFGKIELLYNDPMGATDNAKLTVYYGLLIEKPLIILSRKQLKRK